MKQFNWTNAIYYGEVFGFVFAWAIGLVVALSGAHNEPPDGDAESVVAAHSGAPALD